MVAAVDHLTRALNDAAEALELIGQAEGDEHLSSERGMARVCARAARAALATVPEPRPRPTYRPSRLNPTGRLTG